MARGYEVTGKGKSLTGCYAGKAEDASMGTIDLSLQIAEKSGHVSGIVSSEFGVSKISLGDYKANLLTLKFDVEGMTVTLTARFVANKLIGRYTANSDKGTFALMRRSYNAVFDPNTIKTLSAAQWREDVQFFATELEKRHKNAFHHVTRANYYKMVDRLLQAIPHLNYYQIIVGMDKITANVGDGHTYVHLPRIFHRYPLSLYWFGQDLRTLKTTEPYKKALNARIIAINRVPILTVKRKIREVFSQDETEWLLLASSPSLMMVPEILQTLHVTPDLNSARFSFQTEDGKRFAMRIQADGIDAREDWITSSPSLPTGFQPQDAPFSIRSLESGKEIYVNFTAYDNLKENSSKLFALIDAKAPQKLIIDLRHNDGGDFFAGRQYVIDEIKRRPIINRKGHLFVIIGRETFSAAMTNATDLRKDTYAILVGEPIGEKPNSYQERRLLTLPNSQVVVSYSTKYYSFLDPHKSVVMPDKRIDPSWPSFKKGRDPVMEWILAYPASALNQP
jgi:hypothetical protein